MVVETHPETVGEEDEDHGERGVHETGARGEHSGGEEKEQIEKSGGGMSEDSSNTSNEQSFSKRAEECQKTANRVENHCFISTKHPVHHFRKRGKRNKNCV